MGFLPSCRLTLLLGLSGVGCAASPSNIAAPLGAAAATDTARPSASAQGEPDPPGPLMREIECAANQPPDPYADTRILARCYDFGYLECKLEHREEQGDQVCFRVKTGARYRVSRLRVFDRDQTRGDPLGDPAELAAIFHEAPDAWFSRKSIVDELGLLRRRYRDAGYAMVEAEPLTEMDPANARVSIEVPIRRGPLTTVDRVDIVGNAQVPEATIRAEVLLHAGDLFHETKLEDSRARVRALGAFDSVDISTAEVPGHGDRVAVTIEVHER